VASDRAQEYTASLISESPGDTVFDSVRVGPSNVSKDSEILFVSVNDLINPLIDSFR
jgi:hypothetical protein